MRCRQEGVSDSKTDAAACAGDNDYFRFHLFDRGRWAFE
jgi:hypothetical protein